MKKMTGWDWGFLAVFLGIIAMIVAFGIWT